MDRTEAARHAGDCLVRLKAAMTAHAAVPSGDAEKFGETWLELHRAHRDYCEAFAVFEALSKP